jgi:prepilin-type N-terminal cleavage/methylation domain-containing protein
VRAFFAPAPGSPHPASAARLLTSPAGRGKEAAGFSLIELAIVLVILGLLVGGIMTGQSLIRAAELRSVTADLQRYQASLFTFRDKYLALPGDMRNATQFWGTMTNCGIANPSGTGTQTCNGNGDGFITDGSPAQTGERFTFWQHMANAGFIGGTYTGIAGPNTLFHGIIGQNVPRSRIRDAGFSFDYSPWPTGGAWDFPRTSNHRFWFGTQPPNNQSNGAALRPIEAWNIDIKLDNGVAGKGRIMPWRSDVNPGCSTSDITLNPSEDAAQAVYQVTNNEITCALMFYID